MIAREILVAYIWRRELGFWIHNAVDAGFGLYLVGHQSHDQFGFDAKDKQRWCYRYHIEEHLSLWDTSVWVHGAGFLGTTSSCNLLSKEERVIFSIAHQDDLRHAFRCVMGFCFVCFTIAKEASSACSSVVKAKEHHTELRKEPVNQIVSKDQHHAQTSKLTSKSTSRNNDRLFRSMLLLAIYSVAFIILWAPMIVHRLYNVVVIVNPAKVFITSFMFLHPGVNCIIGLVTQFLKGRQKGQAQASEQGKRLPGSTAANSIRQSRRASNGEVL
ncbi:hypothetical protein BJ742DRAFT_742470 [Cladochytrium replicatum]|nr:hypothetical protein BJ742DRAFT_742470 [Cladochytrium replicatum]